MSMCGPRPVPCVSPVRVRLCGVDPSARARTAATTAADDSRNSAETARSRRGCSLSALCFRFGAGLRVFVGGHVRGAGRGGVRSGRGDEVWRHAWTRVTRRSCWDDGGEPVVTLYGTFKLQKKAPPAPLVAVATGYRHAVVALAARLDWARSWAALTYEHMTRLAPLTSTC